MSEPAAIAERYLASIEQVAGTAAKALRSRGDLSRAGSAEVLAAAAALLPAALARHRRRRKGTLEAVTEVLTKYGQPAALLNPQAFLALAPGAPEPNPRLGGLLGEEGPRVAAFLAKRSADPVPVLGRALGTCAALVLAALAAAAPPTELGVWLDERAESELDDPARLLAEEGFPAEAFRRVRARGFPWWSRVLR